MLWLAIKRRNTMSTSIVYHLFGAVGYKFLTLILKNNRIGFLVESTQDKCCPVCGSKDVILKGCVYRWLRAMPSGRHRDLYLVAKVRRLLCKTCKGSPQEPIELISSEKLHYTKHFEQLVCDLLEFATVKDVANYCGMSWDTIKEIDKQRLNRKKPKWKYKDLFYIAIDEIYLGRLSKYKTIVYDLLSGRIISVIDGRGGKAVERFIKKLASYAKNLKAVAMDMAKAYWGKVLDLLPGVDIVFDRFHVIKLMNEKIDNLRREYQAECEKAERKVIKGKRFLLLKNPENLVGDQKKQLASLLELNTPLTQAYVLKEELRRLWDEPDFESGEKFLFAWCRKAESTGIKAIRRMAKTLRLHRRGILNYFKHGITSGPLEGINNKIKAMLRKHYGIRDPQYLELKLLNIGSSKHVLVG